MEVSMNSQCLSVAFVNISYGSLKLHGLENNVFLVLNIFLFSYKSFTLAEDGKDIIYVLTATSDDYIYLTAKDAR